MATADPTRFEKLLASLKARYGFRELTKILKDSDLGTASGWDALLGKLNEATPDAAGRAEELLRSLNADLVVAGTKDIFIFDLDAAATDSIASTLAMLTASRGDYTDAYPFALSETQLHAVDADHQLVRKETDERSGDISLIFCAKRREEERLTYQMNEVGAAVREAFVGFEEFVAVKRTSYQVFDVLNFRPRLRRVEILIDQPGKLRGTETSRARCLAVLGRMATQDSFLASIYEADTPLNLMPCISALYHASREGRVSHLSFRAPTGSNNKSALASEDLRLEDFHKNGVEAVGDIVPYDVTIAWDTAVTAMGSVSVQIGMPASSISAEDAHVRQARISGARSDAAIAFVANKLVSYST